MSKEIKDMFGVDYEEICIIPTDESDEFYGDKFDTFKEAKESIIDYYRTLIFDSKNSILQAKKLKP